MSFADGRFLFAKPWYAVPPFGKRKCKSSSGTSVATKPNTHATARGTNIYCQRRKDVFGPSPKANSTARIRCRATSSESSRYHLHLFRSFKNRGFHRFVLLHPKVRAWSRSPLLRSIDQHSDRQRQPPKNITVIVSPTLKILRFPANKTRAGIDTPHRSRCLPSCPQESTIA